MAAEIKKATGIEAEVVEGNRGEFTVWVDQDKVAGKTADGFPSDQEAVSAVRHAIKGSA